MLTAQAQELASAWNFIPLEELSPGYCCRAFADDTRVLRVPWQGEELTSGFEAAARLQSAGGPAIFESDPSTGILLMERLTPGTKLVEICNDQDWGQGVLTQVFPGINQLDPTGLPTLTTYYGKPLPDLAELVESAPRIGFLHGDLHHANILRNGQDWRPIDPKGICGDPAYDGVAFLRNSLNLIRESANEAQVSAKVQEMVNGISRVIGCDPIRLVRWMIVDISDWDGESHFASKALLFRSWLTQAYASNVPQK